MCNEIYSDFNRDYFDLLIITRLFVHIVSEKGYRAVFIRIISIYLMLISNLLRTKIKISARICKFIAHIMIIY